MAKGGSKFSKLIRAPIRALGRARDFYVSSMTGCAGKIPYGSMAMGCPAAIPPRSFSFHEQRISSSDDDLRELIRAASLNSRPSKLKSPIGRSQSVVVGRIDEDSPCDFDFQDEIRVGSNLLFPRSISCAPRSRTTSKLGGFA